MDSYHTPLLPFVPLSHVTPAIFFCSFLHVWEHVNVNLRASLSPVYICFRYYAMKWSWWSRDSEVYWTSNKDISNDNFYESQCLQVDNLSWKVKCCSLIPHILCGWYAAKAHIFISSPQWTNFIRSYVPHKFHRVRKWKMVCRLHVVKMQLCKVWIHRVIAATHAQHWVWKCFAKGKRSGWMELFYLNDNVTAWLWPVDEMDGYWRLGRIVCYWHSCKQITTGSQLQVEEISLCLWIPTDCSCSCVIFIPLQFTIEFVCKYNKCVVLCVNFITLRSIMSYVQWVWSQWVIVLTLPLKYPNYLAYILYL